MGRRWVKWDGLIFRQCWFGIMLLISGTYSVSQFASNVGLVRLQCSDTLIWSVRVYYANEHDRSVWTASTKRCHWNRSGLQYTISEAPSMDCLLKLLPSEDFPDSHSRLRAICKQSEMQSTWITPSRAFSNWNIDLEKSAYLQKFRSCIIVFIRHESSIYCQYGRKLARALWSKWNHQNSHFSRTGA